MPAATNNNGTAGTHNTYKCPAHTGNKAEGRAGAEREYNQKKKEGGRQKAHCRQQALVRVWYNTWGPQAEKAKGQTRW